MSIISKNLTFQSNLDFKFSLSCWDRRQTVNLVSAGGLVEQSNAAKNNAVDTLAGSAAGRLAGWLAGWLLAAGAAGGWLADWLLTDWLTD